MNEAKRIQVRSYIMEWVDLLAGHRMNDHDRKRAKVTLSKIEFKVLDNIIKSKAGSRFKPQYKIGDFDDEMQNRA